MRLLITGGAGFIGSSICRRLVQETDHFVLNLDKLNYAGNLSNLITVESAPNYHFIKGDIGDYPLVKRLLQEFAIDIIINLAAETHVDRSIDGPAAFIETNIVGTYSLLNAAKSYYDTLEGKRREHFRFHHVSTDEVFGDLPFDDSKFTEHTPYNPSSPYSASKASSDHLVRAWHHTYGLPVVLSNCSNNYGPFQHPEKLIPTIILNALTGLELPVYGKGLNVRDWLHVDDHAAALEAVALRGRVGESYNIGGDAERTNISVVRAICNVLDDKCPKANGQSYLEQIAFVADRPGHDQRYAIDSSKIAKTLGWFPHFGFEDGLAATVDWYLGNKDWWQPLRARTGSKRLGLPQT